ncbi:MAG: DNA recombination protein RmuC [Nitrospiraceae bacterium]
MGEIVSVSLGLAVSFLIGALIVGVWAAFRLRTEGRSQEIEAAVAETRREAALQNLEDQKALFKQARQELSEAFQALSGEALKTNNEAFLQLAKSSFATIQAEAQGDLKQRHQAINELVKPLHESLTRYEDLLHQIEGARQSAYGGLDQHLRQLHHETGNLVRALRSPTVRGRWGEITLRRVAELAGMVRHCDFFEQAQVTTEEGRLRPDMLVHLPSNRQIVVDAKAVLAAYIESLEAPDENQRLEHLRRHAVQIRSHLDQLSAKAYWSQFPQAPEFVVLFLPGEHFLGAALEQDPTLVEDGFARRIVIATPSSLIALLHAVAYGWRQEQLSEHAQQAGRLGKELFERMSVLAEHLGEVGQALDKSVQAYNRAVSSIEARVLPAARKFKELGIASDKDVPQLDPVDSAPRPAPPVE